MTSDAMLSTATVLVGAGLTIWSLMQLAVLAGYPAFRSRLKRWPIAYRLVVLQGLFAAPALIALLALLAVLVPAGVPAIFDAHCHADAGCAVHFPVTVPGLVTAIVALLCGFALGAVLLSIRLWGIARHVRRMLIGLRAEGDARGFLRLQTPVPLALSVGLWKPRVALSEGLLKRVSAVELEVVLAHENCHRVRRDGLRTILLAALFPLAGWRVLGNQLSHDLACVFELRADAAARVAVGSGLTVADTLLHLHRLIPQAGMSTAIGFGGADLRERVRALANDTGDFNARVAGGLWPVLCVSTGGSALLLLAAFFVSPLHHLIEALPL